MAAAAEQTVQPIQLESAIISRNAQSQQSKSKTASQSPVMTGTPIPETFRKKSRIGKPKAKSGCRTCKIRKLKCDEGRPACCRCSSTGRVCDGYGIWGGGGSVSRPKYSTTVPLFALPLSILTTSMEEKEHFEWFRHGTCTKLHAIFASSFWDTLVFQATSSEPAVLHAVLALSSVHKRKVWDSDSARRIEDIPDKEDQFMLRQYSQAIGHLLPSLSANRKTSVRIALITCVIFICLESLRGRYKTAQVHLQNGLKLLTKRQFHSNKVDENARLCRDLIDDWILESFFQMQMQAELLNYGHRHLFCLLQTSELELPGPTFLSPSQARHHLDQLLQQILHLTEQSRQVHNTHEVSFLELLSRQRRIQAQLVSWLETYQATAARLRTQKPSRDAFAYRLLHIYHTMEDIMAHTCLSSTVSESVFDSHTDQFVSIIVQSIHAWRFTASSHMRLAHSKDMGRWIADRGWIPPLYYTAIKCRNHRVRLQAIKMLEATTHREGIWDAQIAACVARKLMEIEERDFYKQAYRRSVRR